MMRSPRGRVRNVVVRSHHATLLVSILRTACEAREVVPPEVIALSAIGTGSGAPCSNTPPESIHARLGRLADGSIPAPSFPCNPLGMVVERPLNEGVPCSDLGIEAGPLRVFRSPFRPRQRRLPTNSMHRSGTDGAFASRRPKRLHGTVNPPSNYRLLAQLARRRFVSVSNTSSVSATVVLKSSPLRTARSQETVRTSTSAEMWEVHPLGAAPPWQQPVGQVAVIATTRYQLASDRPMQLRMRASRPRLRRRSTCLPRLGRRTGKWKKARGKVGRGINLVTNGRTTAVGTINRSINLASITQTTGAIPIPDGTRSATPAERTTPPLSRRSGLLVIRWRIDPASTLRAMSRGITKFTGAFEPMTPSVSGGKFRPEVTVRTNLATLRRIHCGTAHSQFRGSIQRRVATLPRPLSAWSILVVTTGVTKLAGHQMTSVRIVSHQSIRDLMGIMGIQ